MTETEIKITETHHIASAFDRDLESIQTMIMKIGGMVEQAISDVSLALERNDFELIEKVCTNDAKIDALDEQLNADVVRLISLRAPTAGDLRAVLCVLKMSSNLERIGDYAKNIGRRSAVLFDMDPVGGAVSGIRLMAREVGQMLRDVLDSYIQSDVELAEDVRARDVQIDQMYTSLFREFITHMLEDQRHITACLHLHFIAKNIERMGDHTTNIAEQVVYMITGQLPSDERLKNTFLPTKP